MSRFKKTKLGKTGSMKYPLSIYGDNGVKLANVSLPIGVPRVVAKELKSIIDSYINQQN